MLLWFCLRFLFVIYLIFEVIYCLSKMSSVWLWQSTELGDTSFLQMDCYYCHISVIVKEMNCLKLSSSLLLSDILLHPNHSLLYNIIILRHTDFS